MALLSVKNLSVDFFNGRDRLPVVDRLSFELERGEVLALVGESGCGKSASCLALAGLLPGGISVRRADSAAFELRSGETVDLFRIDSRHLRKIRGREIAYIFQEPSASLNPVFRIGDQIAEVLELHRPDIAAPKAEVIRLLEAVGIPDPAARLRAFPHELSGGMQQRVMIAMALAGDPALLVADEPTTALDVTIQAQILELLERLRRERNMAVILVTHNLGIVAGVADRVGVMYAGQLVEYAPVRTLFAHPVHPYTRALLRAVPHLGRAAERLETIPGVVPSPADFPSGCRFVSRCAVAEAGAEALRRHCAECRPEAKPVSGEENHWCACHCQSGE